MSIDIPTAADWTVGTKRKGGKIVFLGLSPLFCNSVSLENFQHPANFKGLGYIVCRIDSNISKDPVMASCCNKVEKDETEGYFFRFMRDTFHRGKIDK